MTKPLFVVVTYNHKDDDYPDVPGVFPSLSDARNASDELAPQGETLDWVVGPSSSGGCALYSVDIVGTHYVIVEVEVSKWIDWRRPS